jgi:uncharacterized phage protein gp47/JayE
MNSDVKAQLPNSNPFLRASYFGSLIWAFALRIFDLYQQILVMIQQFFINTASGAYLERWGNTYNITRTPATAALGNITISGISGTSIPSSASFQSLTGITYTSTASATVSTQLNNVSSMTRVGSLVTVNFTTPHGLASNIVIDSITGATPADFNGNNLLITITSPLQFQYTLAGTAGAASGSIIAQWTTASVSVLASSYGQNTNADSGTSLTLTSPITGINNTGYAQYDGLSDGTDVEDDASYRARVLYRIQFPFSFFNVGTITTQCKSVAGVTRVWVFSPDTTSALISISSLTRNGQIATAISTSHGLVYGSYVSVSGAVQNEYNVSKTGIIVIDANTFAYPVSGSPATTATGSIAASYSYVELGQVRIGFTRDNDATIIPSAAEVNIVLAKMLQIKPAHIADSDVIVFAPTAVPVTVTFSTLSPNTSAMQTAITNALQDFFRTSNNIGQNIKLADLNGLISGVIDSTGATPIYTLSAPSGDATIGLNKIGILGVVTYP